MGYTKLYRCTNNTGVGQTSLRVILNGLESIVSQYAVPSGWAPGKVGSVVLSGTYNTTITFGGPAVGNGSSATIGWQTGDNSCRLRDLRWGSGASVVAAQQGGVPGGGLARHNHPKPNSLTAVITNDSIEADGWLTFSGVKYAVRTQPLDWSELPALVDDVPPPWLVYDIQSLTDGTPPADPGLDASKRQAWKAGIVLNPGKHTGLLLDPVAAGAALVVRGSAADKSGNNVLVWAEQVVADDVTPDTEVPVIESASVAPNHLWPADGGRVRVTLEVKVHKHDAVWYVADVVSDQPPDQGDWGLDPDNAQVLWLRAETAAGAPARRYTVTLKAVDMAGNVSAPYSDLFVTVEP